ncbi:ABC transporter ATP-binding protein [Pseudonocardia sp. S2-4]|uniref:ABC transporter ATP-binding protein n=1 Tax=Pseudonocardia humida TaxID=2800819 RepID=A0ABT1ADV0_9PSEU|nr:ABC transporter ATP-binding protein [Pseudonocardia humida]
MPSLHHDVPALRTENLTKRYGRLLALDGLDLSVAAGQVFGFLGPNGAGKSTTIRLLLGLARPTAGRAVVFDVPAQDVAAAHAHLAYVPADVALWPGLTGAEILALLAAVGPGTDLAYRDELVERFALDPSLPGRAYSSGNRQKVALVAAFATRAPLLVLDEPTSGLDPLMEQQFRAVVRAARDRGQTVFLSSHQLAEVEAVCDRVAILRAGRLVEVADVAELRALHRTEVTAIVRGPVPDLRSVAAVEGLQVDVPAGGAAGTSRLRFTLTGAPAAALRALAPTDVVSLRLREPGLEEVFLGYYDSARDGGDQDARVAP